MPSGTTWNGIVCLSSPTTRPSSGSRACVRLLLWGLGNILCLDRAERRRRARRLEHASRERIVERPRRRLVDVDHLGLVQELVDRIELAMHAIVEHERLLV